MTILKGIKCVVLKSIHGLPGVDLQVASATLLDNQKHIVQSPIWPIQIPAKQQVHGTSSRAKQLALANIPTETGYNSQYELDLLCLDENNYSWDPWMCGQ